METFSALLAICARNSSVIGEFPAQRPVTQSPDVFFDLCLNEGLSKQSWGWWFETPSRPLWRHSNDSPCHFAGFRYGRLLCVDRLRPLRVLSTGPWETYGGCWGSWRGLPASQRGQEAQSLLWRWSLWRPQRAWTSRPSSWLVLWRRPICSVLDRNNRSSLRTTGAPNMV